MDIELSQEDFDELFKTHIEKMWGSLEMASIQYFVETGKITGSFRLRLVSLMKFYHWKKERLEAAEFAKQMIEKNEKA